jgi:OOP family OmpA-OmpF porin
MKPILATTVLLTGLLASGCATKKYVRTQTSPIQARVEQVKDEANKSIEETRNTVKDVDQRAQTGISGANERAASADARAGEAMNKATAVGQTAEEARNLANKNGQEIGNVRTSVTNLASNMDDYKLHGETAVQFGFNKDVLSPEAKEQLDKLVTDKGGMKRYFIAVEGFADRVGPAKYNEDLSQRRAESVVRYLVVKHDIPVYRIQMVGLGKDKPVDEGKDRAARAKNRRVEVRIFSADEALASVSQSGQGAPARTPAPNTNR